MITTASERSRYASESTRPVFHGYQHRIPNEGWGGESSEECYEQYNPKTPKNPAEPLNTSNHRTPHGPHGACSTLRKTIYIPTKTAVTLCLINNICAACIFCSGNEVSKTLVQRPIVAQKNCDSTTNSDPRLSYTMDVLHAHTLSARVLN